MASFQKQYCWSILLRLFHWMFAISIVTLVTTGFYINGPWTNTMMEGSVGFPMATMRFIHFTAGYTFGAALLIRLFLYFFGNPQEKIWDILPVTKQNITNFKKTLLHYGYVSNDHDNRLGHNVLAGVTYLITFIAAILMVISGFYLLYPEASFWQGLGNSVFGTQQSARYIHHLLMWWFILFAIVHCYFLVWNECNEAEGLISSMITGAKFKHKA